jgi:Rrf2 family protein
MKVSAAEEYGLRCLMRLAVARRDGRSVTTAEVALAEGLSPQYAAKLMGTLRRAGLVRAVRGVRGGVLLARAPETVTIAEAFGAMSGNPLRANVGCGPGGHAGCARRDECGLREVLGTLSRLVVGFLSRVTIADLVEGTDAAVEGSLMESVRAARGGRMEAMT